MKYSIFWNIVPPSLLKVNRHFRETSHLHLHPEDRGNMFLQKSDLQPTMRHYIPENITLQY
jgi:hypothetical protein